MALFGLPPPDPAIEFSIASRGMSKGIAQTDDEPQAVIKASAKSGPLEVGGQWKNVTSTSAKGEAAAFVNASHTLGRLRLNGGAAYKFQTGVIGNPDRNSFEFTAGAVASFGKVSLRTIAIFSPDDLGAAEQSLYIEGGPVLDLSRSLRLSGGAGRRERRGAANYTAFNVGISKTVARAVVLDARYHGTTRSELGWQYKGRIVASARVTL